MKKILFRGIIIIFCAAAFFPVSLSLAQQPRGKFLVMVDPGHGGDDAGVRVSDKYYEKDIVLSIALAIQKELEGSERIRVQLTRANEVNMPVSERIKIAKSVHPDLFISLHINAGFGKSSSGYEVFFPGFQSATNGGNDSAAILKDMEKNKYLNDSVKLAQSVQKNMEEVFPRKGRGLRDAPVPVLEDLTIPAIVVEIAFATNVEDSKRLLDAKIQIAVAHALSRSISEFF
jgi:N-acetylmuramoyl-L-alanine amidase